MTYSDELYWELKKAFPSLTRDRLDTLWGWIAGLPRGKVPQTLLDAHMACSKPEEMVAVLLLCREYAYWQHEIDQKLIKGLSAHKKRRNYPKSFENKEITP